MKLKTWTAAAVMLAVGIELFAVKLPDGKNVRSDEVTSYKSGAIKSVKLREDTEITTPIGTVMADAYKKVYYYENGTVKSIVLSQHEINENLKIVTNFAEADGSTGVINGLPAETALTFCENGALWRIDNNGKYDSIVILVKTPNGILPLSDHLLFYESGSDQPPIIHRAMIKNDKLPTEITLKAGIFTLKDVGVSNIQGAEGLRYGMDGYDISFYKSGAIKKLSIGANTATDCTLTCPIGEVFAKAPDRFPLMFWEDGSLKQCTVDDVMQVEIHGKKVQIPVGGLLRFHRDGSVWAYTTDQKISYTIGKETYTANDFDAPVPTTIPVNYAPGELIWRSPFDTVVLDEKGAVKQILNLNLDEKETLYKEIFLVQSFYPSGKVKKCGGGTGFKLENQKGLAYITWTITTDGIEAELTAYPQGIDLYYYSKQYRAPISLNVYMLYFADNGIPSSYDAIQPISGITFTSDNLTALAEEYRFAHDSNFEFGPFFLLLQMTEDDEFIISKERIRNLEFTERYY